VASVTCSGGPGASMAVVAGQFVYDVADPIHPRLVCRGANTVMHLLDARTIAYTTVAGGHVVIMRRDLSTGAESRIAQLRLEPGPTTTACQVGRGTDRSRYMQPTAWHVPMGCGSSPCTSGRAEWITSCTRSTQAREGSRDAGVPGQSWRSARIART